MRRSLLMSLSLLAGMILPLIDLSELAAQPPQNLYPQPRLQNVLPLGAQIGQSVQVRALGTDLDEPSELIFSHPGIKGEFVEPAAAEAPKDPKAATPAKGNKKAATPPTEANFKVSVAANVPAGDYDVRVVSKYGVSNPRIFSVSSRPEISEKEPNDDVDKAQKVEMGCVVNGVINSPTDVDYFMIKGKAGQRALFHVAAASIDSKARPWIEIYGKDGRRRLAENRNYSETDALADVTFPEDGDYYIRLSEFAHTAGGVDYFYRLTVGTGPWIDGVFPPSVEPGKTSQVTLIGRALPGGKPLPGVVIDGNPVETLTISVTAPSASSAPVSSRRLSPHIALVDAFDFTPKGFEQTVPLFLAFGKVILEVENGNDQIEKAQVVTVPCEIAGRIDRRGDIDWYSFSAKKGDLFMIELFADRLGSGLDLALTIRNAATKQDLANESTLDDDPESLHPTIFFSRSADPPAYRFTAPADGQYLVRVAPQASVVSGPQAVYRLRITPPKPDFSAVVMPRSQELPAAVIARQDGEVAFDVFAHRKDGFSGPLRISAEGLIAGVSASSSTIGTGQKWGTLVLSGGSGLKDQVSTFRIKVSGTIDGKEITHEAWPATITWGVPGQPNLPLVSRLDQSLVLATRAEKAAFRIQPNLSAATIKVDGKDQKIATPFVVKPGEKVSLPVKVIWQEKEARAQPLQLQAEATQQNMQQAAVTVNNGQPMPIPKEKNELPVVVDVKTNAVPGVYSVSLRGETQVKFSKDPAGKDKKDINVQAYAPPIEVRVIPASLAKLSAQAPTILKPGTSAEIVVKVERQFDYSGEFKLAVSLPKEASGIMVEAKPILAGASEVKLKVVAAKDSKVGTVNNVLIEAVALYEGKYETKHETKLNLSVVK